MSRTGMDQVVADLAAVVEEGGYTGAMVCTDDGLPLVSAGEGIVEDQLAALTSLFDDIVMRARRDLQVAAIDEVSFRDPRWGRCVVRPVNLEGSPRFFLVLYLPIRARWRRRTTRLCTALRNQLDHFITVESS